LQEFAMANLPQGTVTFLFTDIEGSTKLAQPDACMDWGDQILAKGAPSMTFEMEDLARLELSRPMLGFAAECRAAFFLQRYPNESAWEEESECIEG
jgi:hypothetical protein